jgi:hypothetical protein
MAFRNSMLPSTPSRWRHVAVLVGLGSPKTGWSSPSHAPLLQCRAIWNAQEGHECCRCIGCQIGHAAIVACIKDLLSKHVLFWTVARHDSRDSSGVSLAVADGGQDLSIFGQYLRKRFIRWLAFCFNVDQQRKAIRIQVDPPIRATSRRETDPKAQAVAEASLIAPSPQRRP